MREGGLGDDGRLGEDSKMKSMGREEVMNKRDMSEMRLDGWGLLCWEGFDPMQMGMAVGFK